jgi:hypothetical protein
MNLFDICTPRQDVQQGNVKESLFAADLAQVLRNEGPLEYRHDPAPPLPAPGAGRATDAIDRAAPEK